MIIDKIENYRFYVGMDEKVAIALKHIADTDFSTLKAGRHEFDGDNIFVIVHDYITKKHDACRLEAHHKYIDVQYIVKGREWIGYTPYSGQTPVTDYDEKNDCVSFNEITSFIKFQKGMFAIFLPTDLHMPGTDETPGEVRKVVVKVKV